MSSFSVDALEFALQQEEAALSPEQQALDRIEALLMGMGSRRLAQSAVLVDAGPSAQLPVVAGSQTLMRGPCTVVGVDTLQGLPEGCVPFPSFDPEGSVPDINGWRAGLPMQCEAQGTPTPQEWLKRLQAGEVTQSEVEELLTDNPVLPLIAEWLNME